MPSLFPERMKIWTAINGSEELKLFIENNGKHFSNLYSRFSRGKDKYANLYLAWLDHIRSYTCTSALTGQGTSGDWSAMLSKYLPETLTMAAQRTILASILHAIQDGIQLQISSLIVEKEENTEQASEQLSDDTALYRVSGWAVKSAIDHKKNDLKHGRGKKEVNDCDLKLLAALKRPKDKKIELPIGAQLIDRGGLTYIHSELLPWVHAVEASMKQFLSESGYRKYGRNIFKVRKGMAQIMVLLLLCYTGHKGQCLIRCYSPTGVYFCN